MSSLHRHILLLFSCCYKYTANYVVIRINSGNQIVCVDEQETKEFKERWTGEFFFVHVHDKALCLLCRDTVAVFKEFNLKRHYETMHQGVVAKTKKCLE